MSDVLEQIRNAISIVELVQEKVTLNKKGREYLGLCPFHHEKTPSFYVNPQKGFYYCFGCQAKGNIFNFYVELFKVTFAEAVQILAKRANINLPKSYSLKQDPKINALYRICNLTTEYYAKKLYSSVGVKALNYLYNRGISDNLIKEFALGYAPKDATELWTELKQHNFYEEYLLEIGLQGYSDKGFVYNFFQNRVMFPIKNTQGKIIAFGARSLDEGQPKYLNSKESSIFSKRANIYSLSQSLVNLRNDNLIVVEGYMDVISLYKYGYNTAVACLGTAITKEHLTLLNKYDKSPIFCLDGDNAGRNATLKVIDVYLSILSTGINPSFVFLPNKEDPDSFLQTQAKEKFNILLQNTKSISEVLWDFESSNKNLYLPEISAIVLQNLQNRIKNIPDSNLRYNFSNYFKELCYKHGKMNKTQLFVSNEGLKKEDYVVDANYTTEVLLLACVLSFPEILPNVEEELGSLTFTNEKLEKLRTYLMSEVLESKNFEISAKWQKYIAEILDLKLVKPSVDNIENAGQALQNFFGTYHLIQRKYFAEYKKQNYKKIQLLAKNLKNTNDNEKKILENKMSILLAEQQAISKQMIKLTNI